MAGPLPGEVPSGAIMQPRYMGRVMNTYPVSEPEMDNISSLSAQSTTWFSVATFLFGLGASIWVNGTFYTEFTPEAKFAMRYVAPFLVLASIGCLIGGIWSQIRRRGAWERIKQTSNPVEAFATPIIAPGEPPSSSATNAAE
jgi:hypothetical protein